MAPDRISRIHSNDSEGQEPAEGLSTIASRAPSTWTNTATVKNSVADVEAVTPATGHGSRFRERFTRIFSDVGTIAGNEEADDATIQPSSLPAWPPLNIEKRPPQCCEHCPRQRKQRKRDKLLIALLIILLLYFLGNIVALNIRTFTTSSGTTTSHIGTSDSVALTADQQFCLSDFTINTPGNASSYPCSTCFGILQGVSSAFLDSSSNAQDAQNIANAIQFCALRSVFDEADADGQSTLGTEGWATNVNFCTWTGVKCNANGDVTSLQLTFPGVPATFSSEIGGLTSLESFEVVGNSDIPAGALPSSFTNLTALLTLELQATAITALQDDLFSSLKNVTTLSLVRNAKMGTSLPTSLTSLPLENLIVTNQALSNPLATLANSSTLQSSLKLLDLSTTNLTGTIPASISSLSALVELHLDTNDLSNPLPSAFPSNLQILTLANNTQLSGTVSGSFCSLKDLQLCDMDGTSLQAAGSCSVCTFA
ncbi:L domain-like protein [Wolfiporia cocos MD-104 SS10]|uniref:L domain-like protein n=1 Tax=Wolfiporia cocos (strain MD-104) TaxID=742152 RepID=A0A2H3JIU5_WOLCO|nr:L domain-like protein [Wolfiporia cocos MD-104 SS10]